MKRSNTMKAMNEAKDKFKLDFKNQNEKEKTQ